MGGSSKESPVLCGQCVEGTSEKDGGERDGKGRDQHRKRGRGTVECHTFGFCPRLILTQNRSFQSLKLVFIP